MTIAACPPSSPITKGVVVFDFAEFIGIYPEFATAATSACQNNFNLATILLQNCCGSPVQDANIRQSLLYMLTAHITYLFTPSGANENSPPGLVGRVDSATQGSVSVSAEMPSVANAAYFGQTKYGAQFWAMTAVFRTMRYIPAPTCAGGFGWH